MINPIKIPRPPSTGISFLWDVRPFGIATRDLALEISTSEGRIINVIKKDKPKQRNSRVYSVK